MELYLVRHGETSWNEAGRIQGWIDVGLAAEGRRQSEALKDELPADGSFDLAVSPLRRARETARHLQNDIPVRHVWFPPEFRELDQGHWNGLRGGWLADAREGRYRGWVDRPLEGAPPGGESLRRVRRRVARGLRFLGRRAGDRVVLVAHKVVNSLCAHLLGEWALQEVMGSLGANASVRALEPARQQLVGLTPGADPRAEESGLD